MFRDKAEKHSNDAYQLYEKGIEYLSKFDLFAKTDECHRFFEGNQWEGLEAGGERLPVLNIIAPIVKYKTAVVAQNGITIRYSPAAESSAEFSGLSDVCSALNAFAARTWENLKLDRKLWELLEDACVCGDCYVYFFMEDGKIRMEAVDNTGIFFSDEQQRDLQKQKYILISSRRFVSDVVAEARENGLAEDELDLITCDGETRYQAGDGAKEEVRGDPGDGKCVSVLKMWKENGEVHISRSTRFVQYQKDTVIRGMRLYPVAAMSWTRKKGGARGEGEVRGLIANQIEINKATARLLLATKHYTFPHLVYDEDRIVDPKSLSCVGSDIAVSGLSSAGDIDRVIRYLQPAQINALAHSIGPSLAQQTRELAGASDAVTGQINPEKASGAAIIAVRDAAAVPLNGAVSAFRQFVEDIALIWFDLWTAYNPNGMRFEADGDNNEPRFYCLPAGVLQQLKIRVRIDVSPANPYSRYAKEKSLENLLAGGHIGFEEYVSALDSDAAAPREKLVEILEKRRTQNPDGQDRIGIDFSGSPVV